MKNVFMAPGILLVFFFHPETHIEDIWFTVLLGIAGAGLVSSANYILNEILDAPRDRYHPDKKNRPIPSGEVHIPAAYGLLAVCLAGGLAAGFAVSPHLGYTLLGLWIMGALYNVPPVRLKDRPYLDVLSESVNNPIRLLLGWYSTGYGLMPPLSALSAYWMFGAFLMAVKRFAEYRHIGDPAVAAQYRHSFGHYTEQRLLESLYFYSAMFALLSGVFIARYRLELVLAIPAVAYTMTYYLHLGFKLNSRVQHPEELYKEKKLMLLLALSFGLCTVLLLDDQTWFNRLFDPWITPP